MPDPFASLIASAMPSITTETPLTADEKRRRAIEAADNAQNAWRMPVTPGSPWPAQAPNSPATGVMGTATNSPWPASAPAQNSPAAGVIGTAANSPWPASAPAPNRPAAGVIGEAANSPWPASAPAPNSPAAGVMGEASNFIPQIVGRGIKDINAPTKSSVAMMSYEEAKAKYGAAEARAMQARGEVGG